MITQDFLLLHAVVEESKELSDAGLIHDVNITHLNNQEVQYTPPSSNWSELFSSRVDLHLGFSCCY